MMILIIDSLCTSYKILLKHHTLHFGVNTLNSLNIHLRASKDIF